MPIPPFLDKGKRCCRLNQEDVRVAEEKGTVFDQSLNN